jgi:hypothetical protein
MRKAMAPAARKTRSSRISSILRFHALAFDSPVLGIRNGVAEEYEGLLDFATNHDHAKIKRIVSVLRSYRLLFGEGLVERDERVRDEVDDLIRYLEELNESVDGPIHTEVAAPRRSSIIPKNLGSVFVKRGFGFPLFGFYRPARIPVQDGFIVIYRSAEADGTARIEAMRKNKATLLEYRDLGVELSTREPSLACTVSPAVKDTEAAQDCGMEGSDLFRFEKYDVVLARSIERPAGKAKPRTVDPYCFEYAYFFVGTENRTNIARFLSHLFSGAFGVPIRSAESIADRFSERLP